jgi:hypothetical protein
MLVFSDILFQVLALRTYIVNTTKSTTTEIVVIIPAVVLTSRKAYTQEPPKARIPKMPATPTPGIINISANSRSRPMMINEITSPIIILLLLPKP